MRWLIAVPAMFIVTIIQVSVFDVVLLNGQIRLDLPLYLLVAIGLSAPSTPSALAGFVLGLVVDLFQFGPFGVHALIYCLAGWTLAEASMRFLQDGTTARTMQGLLATLLVTGMSWLLGAIFGQEPLALNTGPWGVVGSLAVIGVLGGIAVHPMSRLVRRITDREEGRALSVVRV